MGIRCPVLGPSPSAETVTDLAAGIDGVVALRIAVKARLYGRLPPRRRLRHLPRRPPHGRGDRAAAQAPMLRGVVLDTPVGDAQAWRGAGLVLVALLVALLVAGPSMRWPAAVGAVLVATSFAMIGHGLREPRAALAVLVALVLLATAAMTSTASPPENATPPFASPVAGR